MAAPNPTRKSAAAAQRQARPTVAGRARGGPDEAGALASAPSPGSSDTASAAAALEGCFQVAARLGTGERAVIVTIFPDSGTKYLSERFWDEV